MRSQKILRWRKRVRVIPENIRFKEAKINPDLRHKIYKAVFDGRQIKGLYRKRGAKNADSRHVHPLGIVVKGSITYLICMMDEDRINPRYLPIHRFEKIKIIENSKIFQPSGFDLDKFLHKNNLGFELSDKLYTFEAIFDKTMAAHLAETKLNDTQIVKEISESSLYVKARVPDTVQFQQWLMSFGDKVEILSPKK